MEFPQLQPKMELACRLSRAWVCLSLMIYPFIWNEGVTSHKCHSSKSLIWKWRGKMCCSHVKGCDDGWWTWPQAPKSHGLSTAFLDFCRAIDMLRDWTILKLFWISCAFPLPDAPFFLVISVRARPKFYEGILTFLCVGTHMHPLGNASCVTCFWIILNRQCLSFTQRSFLPSNLSGSKAQIQRRNL